jgi:hypothetical protein
MLRARSELRFVLLLATVVSSLCTGGLTPVAADTCMTCLGKPVDVTSPVAAFPLSGFRRVGETLRSGKRVLLIWVGTDDEVQGSLVDAASAAERWPIVKALSQFGSFSHMAVLKQLCYQTEEAMKQCHIGTYDWSRATYESKYVQFAHSDLLDVDGRAFQRLKGTSLKLYKRYSRVQGPSGEDPYDATATVLSFATNLRKLPLVAVGGYVQTVSQVVVQGDFEELVTGQAGAGTPPPQVESGIAFDSIRSKIVSKQQSGDASTAMAVDAEANIITALICHADKTRPKTVCSTPFIRAILKHVK